MNEISILYKKIVIIYHFSANASRKEKHIELSTTLHSIPNGLKDNIPSKLLD